MSELDLLKIQAGKEVTPFTGVTDTVKFMDIEPGDFEFEPDADIEVLRTQVGSLTNNRLAVVNKVMGKGKVGGYVTYDDEPYWIEGAFGIATPSGGGPYTRNYTSPTTPAISNKRYQTLYYGDAAGGISRMLGSLPVKLKYTFEKNKVLRREHELVGQKITDGASFAALSDRSVTPVHGNDLTLYIDTWGGTIGSTAVAISAYSGELEIDTGVSLRAFLGSLNPQATTQPAWKAKLKLHMEMNATTAAYVTAALPGSAVFQRQVRLKFTQGASAILQFDYAGTLTKLPKYFDEEDGMAAVDFEFEDTYNSGLGAWCKIQSVNSISALA